MSDTAEIGLRAEQMIAQLATVSAEPDRLVRLYLTPEHRRAADLVAQWMRAAGMTVSEDALGTVRGRWDGNAGVGKRLLIGSHLDTVLNAGKYDGPLGVIAGILAVDHVARAGKSLGFAIDVLAFGDEEGSRFPATLATSAGCAGAFDRETLRLADRDGVTLAEALRRYGKDVDAIPAAAYRPQDVAAFIEVHIEQGPVLEARNLPLGVVTGIVGQSRLRVSVIGEAGHAGTVAMAYRRDALAGAAELVSLVERIALDSGGTLVGTVGRIVALPGAVNIIPARVDFTVDLRAMDDNVRRGAVARLQAEAWRMVEARGLRVELEVFHEEAAAQCAPALRDALGAAIAALGYPRLDLPSGAGHDAQMMTKLCPSAMLFVRCKGGISHNPAEYASPHDMGLAIAALIHFIENFAPPARS
jgi:allantoate deiminase